MSDPKHDRDRDRNLDDFWDVENLLPQKSPRRPTPSRATPEAVELDLTSNAQGESSREGSAVEAVAAVPLTAVSTAIPNGSRSENRSVMGRSAGDGEEDAPLLEYVPEGALLHRVRIYDWQANYHYFDQFADDAIRYAAMKPSGEAARQTFFSYFPQYVQMGRRATAWYLYWREGVRRGVYADTDYAYVLLYLFELINLPAEEPATARRYRDLMAKVWMAYRRSYPQLDHYMCEWLCDYCLIHGLPAPVDLLAPALDDIIMGSRLKEFYLSAAVRVPENGEVDTAMETARILMRHCCQYDYRKSKFAAGEHKALFDSIIPSAVAATLPMLLGEGGRKPAITMLDSTLTRDAYTGALCSYRNKRRIEVAYTSFSHSHELRFLIGDMVKHVENRLRGWIGVRSKLSVMALPTPLRDALDAYLAPLAPPKNAIPVKKKKVARPAYEALYDLPQKVVSTEDAAAIEADSWETTRILVEAFAEEDGDENRPVASTVSGGTPFSEDVLEATVATEDVIPEAVAPTPSAPSDEDVLEATPLAPYRDFLRAALASDKTALKKAATALGKMPDAVADEINAITADGEIGDIVLEDDGLGAYTVIDDYREAVLAAIEA